MSGLDIFAWIVLVILAISAIAVFCIAGALPGHIAWGEAIRMRTPSPSLAGSHCCSASRYGRLH